MRRTFIAARVSDPFPVPAKALPFPDASLSTRPVCGRNSPVQTGRFPSSVETAKERDRRSVSTRPYRRLIASQSCYSGSMDSISLSITFNYDLSFSLPGSNRSSEFPPVCILYRKTLLIYAHLWLLCGHLWVLCRHLLPFAVSIFLPRSLKTCPAVSDASGFFPP